MLIRYRSAAWILGLALGAGLLAAGGCEPALFPENTPRTQYERFDRLRGHYRPAEQQGPQGDTEPALRRRLTPYE